MQPSEIISVNIWQIVVSLLNLVILFLIVKRFLYKPVTKMLKDRQELIDEQKREAAENLSQAEKTKAVLEERLNNAEIQAEEILSSATADAEKRREKISLEAQEQAQAIVRQAKVEAELERKRVEGEVRTQIIDVSFALGEKLIEREIKEEDHHALIDSFISQIGDDTNEE